jgi:hypothetical protein
MDVGPERKNREETKRDVSQREERRDEKRIILTAKKCEGSESKRG